MLQMIGITLLMLDLVSGVKLKIVSPLCSQLRVLLCCCCSAAVVVVVESPRLAPIIKTRAEIDSDTSGWRVITNTHLLNPGLPSVYQIKAL